jgi:WD40 repeat protein
MAGKMVACCQDGHARVFDFANEKLLYSFRSHYGAMLCSAWSPDNEFLITGVRHSCSVHVTGRKNRALMHEITSTNMP